MRRYNGKNYNLLLLLFVLLFTSYFSLVHAGLDQAEYVQKFDGKTGVLRHVKIDSFGNMLLIYSGKLITESGDLENGLWSKSYDVNGGWGNPQKLHDKYNFLTELYMDADGSAMLLISEDEETSIAIRYDKKIGWEPPESLTHFGDNNFHDASLNNGQVMIADQETFFAAIDGETELVQRNMIRMYIPNEGWLSEVVWEYDDSRFESPRLIKIINIDNDLFALVYRDIDNGLSMKKVKYKPNVGIEIDKSSELISEDFSPHEIKSVIDNQGNTIVLWSEYIGHIDKTFFSVHSEASGWQSVETLPIDIPLDAKFVSDPLGGVYAIWSEGWPSLGVFLMHFTATSGWGEPLQINIPEELDGAPGNHNPVLSLDGLGNKLVVWQEWRGGTYPVARLFSSKKNEWSRIRGLVNPNINNTPAYQIAANDRGDVVVAWRGLIGKSSDGVRALVAVTGDILNGDRSYQCISCSRPGSSSGSSEGDSNIEKGINGDSNAGGLNLYFLVYSFLLITLKRKISTQCYCR